MSGTDFLTSAARFFVKRKLHKKCGVYSVSKKSQTFLTRCGGLLRGRRLICLFYLLYDRHRACCGDDVSRVLAGGVVEEQLCRLGQLDAFLGDEDEGTLYLVAAVGNGRLAGKGRTEAADE